MRRWLLFGGAAAAIAVAAMAWRSARLSSSETPFVGKTKPPEAAPMCPWREPDQDLKILFPGADRYELESRSLSGLRLELAEQLGRPLMPDENLLHIFRVHGTTGIIGAVLTRRVKGTHGAIELVISADVRGRLRGVRIQRIREPEDITGALTNPEWLRSFEGKTAQGNWKIGDDIPSLPENTSDSGAAIVDGIRSSLILLAAGDRPV